MNCRKWVVLIAAVLFSFEFGGCFALADDVPNATRPVLEPPSQLVLTGTPTGFQLTWTLSPQDPERVLGYEIVRASVISGPYIVVGKVDKGVSQFLDTTVIREDIVYYKVRAFSDGETSTYSQVVAGELPGQ